MAPKDVTPNNIAAAMGLSLSELTALVDNVEVCFQDRQMRAVGKKHRPIDPMYRAPKKLFRKLHRWFQSNRLAHPSAHGGVKKRSCFTSAHRHLGRHVWIRDAADCFPSITPKLFLAELLALGFLPESADILTRLCTVRGSIPQGSPISNDAVNLYFWRIDQAMASLCGSLGLAYSRVADDFVISGKNIRLGETAARRLERQLATKGIRVNMRKRNENGFQHRNDKPLVHNILTHNRRGTTISDEHRQKATELAERYVAACKSLHADSLEAVAYKRQKLTGWMYYFRQAEFGPARHVRRLLEVGDVIVRRKLRSLSISAHKGKWWLIRKNCNEARRLSCIWKKRMEATTGFGVGVAVAS